MYLTVGLWWNILKNIWKYGIAQQNWCALCASLHSFIAGDRKFKLETLRCYSLWHLCWGYEWYQRIFIMSVHFTWSRCHSNCITAGNHKISLLRYMTSHHKNKTCCDWVMDAKSATSAKDVIFFLYLLWSTWSCHRTESFW